MHTQFFYMNIVAVFRNYVVFTAVPFIPCVHPTVYLSGVAIPLTSEQPYTDGDQSLSYC